MILVRATRLGLLFLSVLLAGACGTAPPAPSDSYYRLSAPIGVQSAHLSDGIVLVRRFEADGVHSERAILFSDDGQMLNQHHYHFWIDSPTTLLQDQLVGYLREARAAPIVVTDPSVLADLVISGKIKSLRRQLDDGRVSVALEMRLDKVGLGPIMVRTYDANVATRGKKVAASVSAVDQALSEIFTQFIADAERSITTSTPVPE